MRFPSTRTTVPVLVSLFLLSPASLALSGGPATDPGPNPGPGGPTSDTYVVGFWDAPANRSTYEGAPVVDADEDLDFLVVDPPDPDAFQERARRDDRVRYVEPNHHDYELALTPDDSRYPDQYGPQITNTESAWDTTLGATAVQLGFLDTGITASHEDFVADRVSGYDYVNGDSTPEDDGECNNHGSHVAGTAAAATDNGKGVAGMSESSIVLHKIFDGGLLGCRSASTSDIAGALADMGDEGAHVSSNSWSGGDDQALLDAIDHAHDKGVIHVAAAGNDGSCTDCVSDPWRSRPAKVVIVSCTDGGDGFCDFSSQGPEVDLAAPGDGVLSVDGGTTSGYKNLDGTSMSTPHVSGAVALYVAAKGDAPHDDVETVLADSADDVGLSSARQGAGRLDTAGLLLGGNAAPTASFTYGCKDLTCDLDASNSSDSDGSIASYEWAFDDGTTGTGANTSHAYGSAGTYAVELKVTDDGGATDTEVQHVTAGSLLLDDGFEDGDLAGWNLAGDSTNLWRAADDCRTPAHGGWQLAFSRASPDCDYDVGTAQEAATTGTLDAAGTDDLVLAFDHFYDVEAYDEAEYDVMRVQVSDDGGGNWTTVDHWDSVDHTNGGYTQEEYDISSFASSELRIRFSFDSKDDVNNDQPGWYVDDVEVAASGSGNSAPAAEFTYSCDDLECSFDASGSSDGDGSVDAHEWEFGDGAVGAGQAINHTYEAGGDYTVNLTVTDDDGATDTTNETLTVSANVPPEADFTYSCTDLECSFDASGSSDDGAIASHDWAFGDGATGTGELVNHTYEAGGDYTVNLTVTDDDGATDTTNKTVSVTSNDPPSAEFTYGCTDLSCSYNASGSSDPDGAIASHDWEFGDGATGTGELVNHTYEAGGDYTVNLTVTDDDGATDTASKTVSVFAPTTSTLYAEDFDDAEAENWTKSDTSDDLWRLADDCATPASGSWQLAFSRASPDCDYDVGTADGWAESPTIDAGDVSSLTLNFSHFYEVEDYADGEYDLMRVQVSDDGGSSWTTIDHWDSVDHTNGGHTERSYDVSDHATSQFQVRFQFDTKDDVSNDQPGWYVDDVEVLGS